MVDDCSAHSWLYIVPGWDALEAYAKSNWGSGSWNIVTNPKDVSYSPACISCVFLTTLFKYPGSPASVCVSDDPVKMELDGIPI